jgi:ABC-type uncharacterized transport system ATPase subunit
MKDAGKSTRGRLAQLIDINRVCDRVVVLESGKKIYDGDVSVGDRDL